LQAIIKLADEADEEPGGRHHYRKIDDALALKKVKQLDELVGKQLEQERLDEII
jgi:uncharacterized protein